jgi:hypothetical protein
LQNAPGEHLIFVRYEKAHDPHKEWVYNSADIDGSKVVWAHDMGEEQNQVLLRYFKARQAWELDADQIPPKVAPYGAQ